MANPPTREDFDRLVEELDRLKVREEKIVVIQKEKSVQKFSGSSDSVSDFVSEIKVLFDSRKLSEKEKVDAIYSSISKSVRDELKCCPPETQKDAALILKTLEETYGDRRCVSDLLGRFYNVQHRDGETVRTYSHRLKGAYDALCERQKALGAAPVEITLLRDHFINQLNSSLLRKKLKERVYETHTLNFYDVRDIAIRWAEDEEVRGGEGVVMSVQQDTLGPQLAKLQEVMERVEKEVKSLGHRVQTLETSRQPQPPPGATFTKSGKPICVKCRQPGHIGRHCTNAGNGMGQ